MHTIRGNSASRASRMALAAEAGGTKITLALASVASMAAFMDTSFSAGYTLDDHSNVFVEEKCHVITSVTTFTAFCAASDSVLAIIILGLFAFSIIAWPSSVFLPSMRTTKGILLFT